MSKLLAGLAIFLILFGCGFKPIYKVASNDINLDGYSVEFTNQVSREIIEESVGDIVLEQSKKIADPNTEIIYIVINAISKFMGINLTGSKEFNRLQIHSKKNFFFIVIFLLNHWCKNLMRCYFYEISFLVIFKMFLPNIILDLDIITWEMFLDVLIRIS